jgi:hypothetical protein
MTQKKYSWSTLLGLIFASLALAFVAAYFIVSTIDNAQSGSSSGFNNENFALSLVFTILMSAYLVVLLVFKKKTPAWAMGTAHILEAGCFLILGAAILLGAVFVVGFCAVISASSSASSSVETSLSSSITTSASSESSCSEQIMTQFGNAGFASITAALLALSLIVASYVSGAIKAPWQWYVLLGCTVLGLVGATIAFVTFIQIKSFAFAMLFLAWDEEMLSHLFFLFKDKESTVNPAEVH